MPPVHKIELTSKHMKLRLVAAALLLLIGAGALAYAFMGFMTGNTGWQEVEVSATDQLSTGSDFVLYYNVGASGTAASVELRALRACYTEASIHAYRLFDTVQGYEDVINLYDLNHRPNEVFEVEDTLYQAFALLEQYGSRALYLGPVYQQYQSLFFCNDDSEAVYFDPAVDDASAIFVAEAVAYAQDPDAVKLELLGNGQVRLNVSQDYLDWAEYNDVTCLLDFFWLKNAFVADYLADTLIDSGYTLGTLSSYDGFIRNLDDSGTSYSFNIYDRVGTSIYPAGVMDYTGAISLVYLRDYPVNSLDFQHYYEWQDGKIRNPYIDLADGLCHAAVPDLVCYSWDMSCAEVLMRMLPVYVAEDFSAQAVGALADSGVWSVYCQDHTIYHTAPELSLRDLYDANGVRYTVSPAD